MPLTPIKVALIIGAGVLFFGDVRGMRRNLMRNLPALRNMFARGGGSKKLPDAPKGPPKE
jgi:hypothetical protein